MKPLNYAILKHFTTVEKACAEEVMDVLKGRYGHFKAFNKKDMLNALMTARANGLLEEAGCELGASQELRVYFRAHAEGAATINRYIRD
jgi:hypothetical protein